MSHSKIITDFGGAWRAFARHAPPKSVITFLIVTLLEIWAISQLWHRVIVSPGRAQGYFNIYKMSGIIEVVNPYFVDFH
jgi:hypothetical protein